VNETTDGKRHALSTLAEDGPLVLRGSNVSLYALRAASQGETLFLRESAYLEGKKPDSKAFHGRQSRIGFQRSSPQNNFRRIVACFIPPNQYCFDTISYIPQSHSQLLLYVLLALLNSKLLDWYFRLGSTNSKVNEYQFNNLPCPIFTDAEAPHGNDLLVRAFDALRTDGPDAAVDVLVGLLDRPPFSRTVASAIARATEKIMKFECKRGQIARSERSELSDSANPYQQFIDMVLFRMAGLSAPEAKGLEYRLSTML
jgi:hypothetical protein